MVTMAEVLAKHIYWGFVDGVGQTRCECGGWFADDAGFVAHLEQELVEAGFGRVVTVAPGTEELLSHHMWCDGGHTGPCSMRRSFGLGGS